MGNQEDSIFSDLKFRDAKEAFSNAIEKEVLSEDETQENFAGNYMYMYSSDDLKIDYFKHINTREYIEVGNKGK